MIRFPTDSFSYFSDDIFKFMIECGLLDIFLFFSAVYKDEDWNIGIWDVTIIKRKSNARMV
jgi:hypothetical protein